MKSSRLHILASLLGFAVVNSDNINLMSSDDYTPTGISSIDEQFMNGRPSRAKGHTWSRQSGAAQARRTAKRRRIAQRSNPRGMA